MAKEKRREHLLDVALDIVRAEGADALTLGELAMRAGVSRPIAYAHFETRAGLLLALIARLENRYVAALQAALSAAPRDLASVAELISRAYFGCHAGLGAEAPAISAALKGSDEMATRQRQTLATYVGIMCEALAPFSPLGDAALRLRCAGLLGAAEAIAREVEIGGVSEAEAVAAFAALVAAGIS